MEVVISGSTLKLLTPLLSRKKMMLALGGILGFLVTQSASLSEDQLIFIPTEDHPRQS